MNQYGIFAACALLGVTAAASAALEQAKQAERAVETRQSVLQLMGWNMALLSAVARGRIDFDAKQVETNASPAP